MMNTPQRKDALHFIRLRNAATGKDLKLKQTSTGVEQEIAPYLPEDRPWRDAVEYDHILRNQYSPVLFDRLGLELSLLTSSAQIEKIRAALSSSQAMKRAEGLVALRVYLETHPADELESPILRVAKELPKEVSFYRGGPNQFAALALGQLPSLSNSHFSIFTSSPDEPSEVEKFIHVFKVAKDVYGKNWEEHDPENLRLIMKQLVRLEWEEANPILKKPAALKALAEIKGYRNEFQEVASEAMENNQMQFFAWPYFIQQLWEDEQALHERFVAEPFTGINKWSTDDEKKRFLSKKEYETTIELLGEKLIPFADQTLRKKDQSDTEWFRAVAQEAIMKHGPPEAPELREPFDQAIREIQWKSAQTLRQEIAQIVESPDVFQQALRLEQGYFRDFFLSEAWKKEPKKTRRLAEEYLSHMQKEVPDSAKANRAPDLMNRYVRDHYFEGTASTAENQEKTKQRVMPCIVPDERAANAPGPWKSFRLYAEDVSSVPANELWMRRSTITNWETEYQKTHQATKSEFREKVKNEALPSPKDLYLFSETIARSASNEVVLNERSYATRITVEVAQSDMRSLEGEVEKGIADPDHLESWVTKHLPQPCAFRDFFLENALHVRLWNHLRKSRLGPRLAELGIKLNVKNIKLAEQFTGKDEGVLSDAYLKEYSLFRVDGLVSNISVFTPEEQGELADILRKTSVSLTSGAGEIYERVMVELESERIRQLYHNAHDRSLQQTDNPTSEQKAQARAKAFEAVFHRITEPFPLATYNRDGLLERFALDYATTPDQARRVEEATYDFLVRRPEVQKAKGEKIVFGPVETVKNYLANFSDRDSRARILGWIFGGELPDDRYLEGREFKVDADQEREGFWLMSHAERKAVLYGALLGDHGIFEVPPGAEWGNGGLHDDYKKREAFEKFLEEFYKNNFDQLLEQEPQDSQMRKIVKTVFFETFKNYSAPRRVELFLALVKKMQELRQRDEKLNVGQAMRLFLEQVGVVGIKVGQVLSEREDVVSDQSVRSELSSLRDRAAPFAKYGVFTYLRMAGLFVGSTTASTAPFRIAEVDECLGSASIKQAHRATTTNGELAVVKVPRPTIDKNYQEDLAVLRRVMDALRNQGVDVPEHLLPEVADACEAEFDFGVEAAAQNDIETALHRRKATVRLGNESIRLNAPKLAFMLRKGEGNVKNLQLMIDEYVPGLNLGEVEEYQRLKVLKETDPTQLARLESLHRKIEQIYGEQFPQAEAFYKSCPIEDLRAQLGIDLMVQIAIDGTFHADSHAGNLLIDAAPKKERVAFIDFGSVGRSVEVLPEGVRDHRPAFRDFLRGLILLKVGFGDPEGMGKTINEYVEFEGGTPEFWKERVQELASKHAEVGSFFKGLLGEMLSRKAKINRQFKFLLKAMAAGGSHFDALSKTLTRGFQSAMVRSMSEGKPIGEILFEDPVLRGLKPFVESDPALKGMLGL